MVFWNERVELGRVVVKEPKQKKWKALKPPIETPIGTSHSQIMVIPQWENSVPRFTRQAGHGDLDVWLEDIESACDSDRTSLTLRERHISGPTSERMFVRSSPARGGGR